jgi:outer membrane immunogenic protein
MKLRAIVTGATLAVCGAAAANAADVGGLKDTPFVTAPWSWAGFYGGFTAGYGTGDSSNWVGANANNAHGWASNNPDGGLLGGTVGYNWQYTPNWVLGVEADFSWGNLEGQQHKYIYDGHDWSGGWDGFATIRGRAGYALGPTLIYATAGIAFVHTNEVIVGNDADESNFYQGWHTGYVVGAGVEHAFTERLSAKVEYLFADGFAEASGRTGTINGASDQNYKHNIGNIDIIRVGLNYKFF